MNRKLIKKGTKKVLHGEDVLAGLEAVRVTLEDGKTHTFNFDAELRIPQDPDERDEAVITAPARFTFWSYQTERALALLRAKEREFDRLRGEAYIIQRRYISDHTTDMPTEANITARLDAHPDLIPAKEALDQARRKYGVLRSLRDGLEHRTYVLRRLTAQRKPLETS